MTSKDGKQEQQPGWSLLKPSSWSRGKKAKVAHLGEESNMYYNEKLKRWVEKGKEDEAANDPGAGPPPTMATGIPTAPVPRKAINQRYVLQSNLSVSSSASSLASVPSKPLLVPPPPTEGLSAPPRFFTPSQRSMAAEESQGEDLSNMPPGPQLDDAASSRQESMDLLSLPSGQPPMNFFVPAAPLQPIDSSNLGTAIEESDTASISGPAGNTSVSYEQPQQAPAANGHEHDQWTALQSVSHAEQQQDQANAEASDALPSTYEEQAQCYEQASANQWGGYQQQADSMVADSVEGGASLATAEQYSSSYDAYYQQQQQYYQQYQDTASFAAGQETGAADAAVQQTTAPQQADAAMQDQFWGSYHAGHTDASATAAGGAYWGSFQAAAGDAVEAAAGMEVVANGALSPSKHVEAPLAEVEVNTPAIKGSTLNMKALSSLQNTVEKAAKSVQSRGKELFGALAHTIVAHGAEDPLDLDFESIMHPGGTNKLDGPLPWELPDHLKHSDQFISFCLNWQKNNPGVEYKPDLLEVTEQPAVPAATEAQPAAPAEEPVSTLQTTMTATAFTITSTATAAADEAAAFTITTMAESTATASYTEYYSAYNQATEAAAPAAEAAYASNHASPREDAAAISFGYDYASAYAQEQPAGLEAAMGAEPSATEATVEASLPEVPTSEEPQPVEPVAGAAMEVSYEVQPQEHVPADPEAVAMAEVTGWEQQAQPEPVQQQPEEVVHLAVVDEAAPVPSHATHFMPNSQSVDSFFEHLGEEEQAQTVAECFEAQAVTPSISIEEEVAPELPSESVEEVPVVQEELTPHQVEEQHIEAPAALELELESSTQTESAEEAPSASQAVKAPEAVAEVDAEEAAQLEMEIVDVAVESAEVGVPAEAPLAELAIFTPTKQPQSVEVDEEGFNTAMQLLDKSPPLSPALGLALDAQGAEDFFNHLGEEAQQQDTSAAAPLPVQEEPAVISFVIPNASAATAEDGEAGVDLDFPPPVVPAGCAASADADFFAALDNASSQLAAATAEAVAEVAEHAEAHECDATAPEVLAQAQEDEATIEPVEEAAAVIDAAEQQPIAEPVALLQHEQPEVAEEAEEQVAGAAAAEAQEEEQVQAEIQPEPVAGPSVPPLGLGGLPLHDAAADLAAAAVAVADLGSPRDMQARSHLVHTSNLVQQLLAAVKQGQTVHPATLQEARNLMALLHDHAFQVMLHGEGAVQSSPSTPGRSVISAHGSSILMSVTPAREAYSHLHNPSPSTEVTSDSPLHANGLAAVCNIYETPSKPIRRSGDGANMMSPFWPSPHPGQPPEAYNFAADMSAQIAALRRELQQEFEQKLAMKTDELEQKFEARLEAVRSEITSEYEQKLAAMAAETDFFKSKCHSLQSDLDELLLCLGQESSKVTALSDALRNCGLDPLEITAPIEEEYAAMEAAPADE